MKSPEHELPVVPREILERPPGRSFSDPRRPLGEDLIERAGQHGGDPEEGFYGRASEHFRDGNGVPERAKCVAVLRKADELMAENNPPGDTAENQRRALELACGRCGVHVDEYDRLVEGDEEVRALEAVVLQAAHLRALLLRGEAVTAPASVG
ncbi:MAG: hypothetical protein KF894_24555 [Labilithrix sp.]|nr:hypothetical protein [Labilithrix sp.]